MVIFLVLVWLDSAAFAIVQANPELKAQTWGSAGQKIVQGSVHLVAAVGAGALLDAGFGLAVPLASWVLFAVAFPLLQSGGSAAAGPIYATGISLYSVALVVMPTLGASHASPPPRWRAGLLYGVAGWLGSALGVGMAQDLGHIPAWFLFATGAVLAVTLLLPSSPLSRKGGRGWERGARGVRGLILLGILAVALEALATIPSSADVQQGGTDAAVLRGRKVYVAEGCIHCHSQYVRPGTHDESWWGSSRPLDRAEEPLLVGSRRQGPDLLAVGNRRSEVWHELHLRDPRALNPGSRMPSYAHLFAGDGQRGRDLVAYLTSLGADTGAERWALTESERIAPPPAPPSISRGSALFATYCAACHGRDARGDGRFARQVNDPYTDLRQPGFHSVPQGVPLDQALVRIIRHGLPPTSMPGHEWLTDQQVADLAVYVKTLETR